MLGVGDAAAERAERVKSEARLDAAETALQAIWSTTQSLAYQPPEARVEVLERVASVAVYQITRYRTEAAHDGPEMKLAGKAA